MLRDNVNEEKYIAEEGESCLLQAAVVCSSPWNCEKTNFCLERTWLGKEVYLKVMGGNMKKVAQRNYDALKENPNINWERLLNAKYLYEFDLEIQCPTWGYPTVGAYVSNILAVLLFYVAPIDLFIHYPSPFKSIKIIKTMNTDSYFTVSRFLLC